MCGCPAEGWPSIPEYQDALKQVSEIGCSVVDSYVCNVGEMTVPIGSIATYLCDTYGKGLVPYAASPSEIKARHTVVQACGEIPLDRMTVPFLEHTVSNAH